MQRRSFFKWAATVFLPAPVVAPVAAPVVAAVIDKEAIIAAFISTPEGKRRLAASMVQPLRTRVDYTSLSEAFRF